MVLIHYILPIRYRLEGRVPSRVFRTLVLPGNVRGLAPMRFLERGATLRSLFSIITPVLGKLSK